MDVTGSAECATTTFEFYLGATKYTATPSNFVNVVSSAGFNPNNATLEMQTAAALTNDNQYSKCSLDCLNLYIAQEEGVPTLSESALAAEIFA